MVTKSLSPPNVARDLAFSGWIDFFRGVAALAVLYSHARVLFLKSMAPDYAISIISRGMYFLSGYGHISVMVFFVLSGFLVGGTVIRARRDDRWSWRRYAIQRGTRLYVVLIPALLLTAVWGCAEKIQRESLVANDDTAVAIIPSQTIRENSSPAIFAGNLAFLQTIFVPPFGSNPPLWSLANEFWYYVIFPLAWIALARGQTRLWTRLLYFAIAALLLVMVGKGIAIYFIIWLMGCLVWLLPEIPALADKSRRRTVTALAGGMFLTVLVAVRFIRGWNDIVLDLLVGVAFAVLLYCLKHNRLRARFPRIRQSAAFLAEFSYTLYLVHLPPLIFLRACLTYETAWPASPWAWTKVFLIIAAVLFYAYAISLVTERQTDRVRRWLEGLIGLTRARYESASVGEARQSSISAAAASDAIGSLTNIAT